MEENDAGRISSAMSTIAAKQCLILHLVGLLMRERALAKNQTAQDILEYSEEVKCFFADRLPPGTGEAHITPVVDEFFNGLASDVRDLENRELWPTGSRS